MHQYKAEANKQHKEKLHRMIGGKTSTHPDEKEDRKLVDKMVKKSALTGKATGGKAKDKGTKVNILVAPKGGQAGPSTGPSAGSGLGLPSPTTGPVVPPVPVNPRGVSGVNRSPGANPMIGQVPPSVAAKGGRVKTKEKHRKAKGGKITAGAGSGVGRLEK